MSELPLGWIETEIGNLCELYNGRAFKKTEWTNHGIPIIRIQNLNNSSAMFNYYSGDVDPRNEVVPGNLLFAWSGTPGTSFGAHEWNGVRGALNQHIYKIDFDENKICKSFFRYAINQKLSELIENAQGAVGLRHVTKSTFTNTKIAFPPLNEQIRIANKLDSLLAKVDAAQARLEKIPTLLKRFRQSVLAAATSGELTREWRGENEIQEWSIVPLIDLVESKPRNGFSPKGVDYETPIKNLTLSAVTKGHFLPDCFKFVDIEVSEDSHLWVKNGDILIQRANSIEYVGVSALYEGESDQYIYPDLMMKCRANDKVVPKYLHYSLLSESVRKYFRDNATGTTGNMPKINQVVVSNAPINTPPIHEQLEIVHRVESLFDLVAVVEKQYQDAKNRIDRVTQSLLSKAFRGELVEQDSNDEPASVLLDRISKGESEGKEKKISLKTSSKKSEVTRSSLELDSVVNSVGIEMDLEVADLKETETPNLDRPREKNRRIVDKALMNLKGMSFTVDQFLSVSGFAGSKDEFKYLLMNLLKGIPGVSDPLLEIEAWDKSTGDYKLSVKDSK